MLLGVVIFTIFTIVCLFLYYTKIVKKQKTSTWNLIGIGLIVVVNLAYFLHYVNII